MRPWPRSISQFFVALAVNLACIDFGGIHAAAAASTAAGTVITNTSTGSYSDSNAASYNATSNTVSVTVQNAPSMTVTQSSNQKAAPGQTVTDTFTVANTGNASGNVQLAGAATIGGSDSASTTVTYLYNSTSYSTYTALNTALNLPANMVTTTTPINIGVVYALASSAAVGDVSTNIVGTITYAATGNATAQTSASATAATAEDDSVLQDAILDVALSSSNTSGTITYIAKASDRTTTWGAKDLSSVGTLLGLSSSGVLISVKIPQFPANTPLTITGTPTVTTSTTNGFGGGTATIYSTANATGAGGWTAGMVANAVYIGVYITGGTCTNGGVASTTGIEICAVTGGTGSSAGTVPNPAVSLTFAVTASTASGSANTGSTTTIANSLIGDNSSTEHVIAPSITQNSLLNSAATAATLTATGEGVNNVTPATSAMPSGASNIDSDQSIVLNLFYNGPFANAGATGSVDGSANDIDHDFTAVSFSSSANYITTDTAATYSPTTVSTTTSTSTVSVENTITNSGNKADTYTIVAGTLPSGWTVVLQTDTGTAGTTTAGAPSGTALGSATAGTTSTATAVSVASGSSVNYWAVYTVPSGVTYLSHQSPTLIATSANSSTTNTTYNLLYAGFVAIVTTATTTPGCPSSDTNTTGTVCPGGSIQYTIAYRNIVGGSSNYDSSSVPAVSFKGVSTAAGSFTITADGTTSANWATYTNGPTVAPADTTANTTYIYTPGGTSTLTTPVTKFVATVGGSAFQLVPYGYNTAGAGSYGQITYSVTVK